MGLAPTLAAPTCTPSILWLSSASRDTYNSPPPCAALAVVPLPRQLTTSPPSWMRPRPWQTTASLNNARPNSALLRSTTSEGPPCAPLVLALRRTQISGQAKWSTFTVASTVWRRSQPKLATRPKSVDPELYYLAQQPWLWGDVNFAMSLPLLVLQHLLRAGLDTSSGGDRRAYARVWARAQLLSVPDLAAHTDRGGSLSASLGASMGH